MSKPTDQHRDIVERFRDAQLNHDEFRFGWLAEANDELTTLREERASLRRRVAELEAIVDRLPKTADGVPILAGDTAWLSTREGLVQGMAQGSRIPMKVTAHGRIYHYNRDTSLCYSTREAAEAAAAKQNGDE